MKSWDIVAYTYSANQFTPSGLIQTLINEKRLTLAALDMREEDALDQLAAYELIDREDERSFDSDSFPKVIFRDQVEDWDQFVNENGDYVKLC